MPEFKLTLFGTPSLSVDGVPQTSLHKKDLALLCYLSAERGSHERERLAYLLWSDSGEDQARASLRQTLKRLRAVLGEQLVTDRTSVRLGEGVASDLAAFLSRVDDDPEAAVEYDVPEFLGGSLHHAAGFEEWAEAGRGRLMRRYVEAMESLARGAMRRWRWSDASRWAERGRAVAPLSDLFARVGVEATFLRGNRSGALELAAEHAANMERELGTGPGVAFLDLVRQIEADEAPPPAGPITKEWHPSTPVLEPPLVGRDQAWQVLTQAWAGGNMSGARWVVVSGSQGLGKTRLLSDYRRWVRTNGATVLAASCYDPQMGVPYGPVADLLAEGLDAPGLAAADPVWLAEVGRLIPELRRRFPDLPTPAGRDSAEGSRRLSEGVVQTVCALADEKPVVVALDDLHLADPQTCSVLRIGMERWAHCPILVVMTAVAENLREAPGTGLLQALRSHADLTTVELTQLGAEEVAEIVDELGGLGLQSMKLAAKLIPAGGGNPRFLLELIKAMFEAGAIETDTSGNWVIPEDSESVKVAFPDSVHQLVGSRISLLPEPLNEMLVVIAAEPLGLPPEVLARTLGRSPLETATLCDELLHRGLAVMEGTRVRAASRVIAAVVRRPLSTVKRVEVHRTLSRVLTDLGGGDPTWNARARYHLARAEDPASSGQYPTQEFEI